MLLSKNDHAGPYTLIKAHFFKMQEQCQWEKRKVGDRGRKERKHLHIRSIPSPVIQSLEVSDVSDPQQLCMGLAGETNSGEAFAATLATTPDYLSTSQVHTGLLLEGEVKKKATHSTQPTRLASLHSSARPSGRLPPKWGNGTDPCGASVSLGNPLKGD